MFRKNKRAGSTEAIFRLSCLSLVVSWQEKRQHTRRRASGTTTGQIKGFRRHLPLYHEHVDSLDISPEQVVMDMYIMPAQPHVRFPTALFHSATTMTNLGKQDKSMQERSESSSKRRIRDLALSLLYWFLVTSLVTTATLFVAVAEEVDLATCHAPRCRA